MCLSSTGIPTRVGAVQDTTLLSVSPRYIYICLSFKDEVLSQFQAGAFAITQAPGRAQGVVAAEQVEVQEVGRLGLVEHPGALDDCQWTFLQVEVLLLLGHVADFFLRNPVHVVQFVQCMPSTLWM